MHMTFFIVNNFKLILKSVWKTTVQKSLMNRITLRFTKSVAKKAMNLNINLILVSDSDDNF